ncbi:MAG: Nif11-like leader peptide family natural product precursor [Cyanobacteria bacterium P01_A01_bin.84]
MSLENAKDFYQVLGSNEAIYEQYYKQCSRWGAFGIWNWDKKAIISFAATLGYHFTENELDRVWFQPEASTLENSQNLSISESFSSIS